MKTFSSYSFWSDLLTKENIYFSYLGLYCLNGYGEALVENVGLKDGQVRRSS